MSGFRSNADGDFERVFMTENELIDQFVGERLWTWGGDYYGNSGSVEGTRSSPGTTTGGGVNWKQVAAPSYFPGYAARTYGIKTDGTLWATGSNTSGALGDGTGVNKTSFVLVAGGITDWKQVAVAYLHGAAIRNSGQLMTWGANTYGELGTNTSGAGTSRSSPGNTASATTNWKMVSCGAGFTAAIKTDGTLWTWGNNGNGYLGNGNTSNRSSPGQEAGAANTWKTISCGSTHVGAIKTDGTLWTWGVNNSGCLGNSGVGGVRTSPDSVTGEGNTWKQISCGYNTTAAIKTDGTLWICGNGTYGQQGDGTATSRNIFGTTAGGGTTWKTVSMNANHAAAVKTDGTLWTWGYGGNGDLGNDVTTNRSSPGTTVSNSDWKSVTTGGSWSAGIAN